MKTFILIICLVISRIALLYVSEHVLLSAENLEAVYQQTHSKEIAAKLIDIQTRMGDFTMVLLAPMLLIKIFFVSVALYAAIYLLSHKGEFAHAINITVKAELVYTVMLVVPIVWYGLIEPGYSIDDIRSFEDFSLARFASDDAEAWQEFLLGTVSVFRAGYILALVAGTSATLALSYANSASVVLAGYGTLLLLQVSLIAFYLVSHS